MQSHAQPGATAQTLERDAMGLDVEALSAMLCDLMQQLVQLAGGWITRPVMRRRAYASNEAQRARRQLVLLQKLEDNLRHISSVPPCSPWLRVHLMAKLCSVGVDVLGGTVPAMLAVVEEFKAAARAVLERCVKTMRAD